MRRSWIVAIVIGLLISIIGLFFVFEQIQKPDKLVNSSTSKDITYMTSTEFSSLLSKDNGSDYNGKVFEITGEVNMVLLEENKIIIKGMVKNIKVNFQKNQDLSGINTGSFVAIKGIAKAPISNESLIELKSAVIKVK
ncbi:hypothetical protein K5V21_14600 [Clostridium sardiniense]|uniref:tRNA_anti-like n=1 Tax=Clostridium sardiniense TaxID=29369 RepID=A0ABS7L0V9_CLOSR|nr:hypothetical protein [Clostridium sardiniense]MBY0756676.1 hypothetical protein [Clostridium sardiniense]MDQ0458577.1 hypothetical protein [Clostridium sardiniense]